MQKREQQQSGQKNGTESYTALALLFSDGGTGLSAGFGCWQSGPATNYSR
jgi:hypothetical protein